MSPRGSSSTASSNQPTCRNSGTPYSRRPSSQPKSSRQQFSACGACRMRRVRCDLKDLPIGTVGPYPACSNCKERAIKCVDEFADVKAVKLLRRGRRLQQVEAIYGKTGDHDRNLSSSSLPSGPRMPSNIPALHPEFFSSAFWHWFAIQRPILDASEFPVRFAAHCKGAQNIGNEGLLISTMLVVWAASFGLDERGLPDGEELGTADSKLDNDDTFFAQEARHPSTDSKRRRWKNNSEACLKEVLELVDFHGIMRRPSLDGVRVLLLLLPLMEEAQPLERLAIYEATLSQVQALCAMSALPSSGFDDAAIRARIFWYAYTQEGIATGIRGGRFVLDNDDLDTFQRTLPALNFGIGGSSHPRPPSPSVDLSSHYHTESGHYTPRDLMPHKAYVQLITSASVPLDLSNVCRKIHAVLTGIKATRRAEDHGLIDAHGMREIWRDLDRCWQEFDALKQEPLDDETVSQRLDIEQYVHAWQIFIFECHNVIREALKHFISNPASQGVYPGSSPSRPSSHSSNSSPYLSPQHLHLTATRKCLTLLPRVIQLLRFHLSAERHNTSGIFKWDVGLVRDGCFFAGYLAASMDGDILDITPEGNFKQEEADSISRHLTTEDSVSICLTALAAMRWGFSKSEEREETVRMIWEDRKLRRSGQPHHNPHYESEYPPTIPLTHAQIHLDSRSSPHLPPSMSSTLADRPMLPPLNLFISQRRVESAPSTAASTDGRGLNGWPSYTPPGTATSVATSGTGFSGRGSPVFAHLASFKTSSDDMFYHTSGDLDHFSYNPPMSAPLVREGSVLSTAVPTYNQRHSSVETHALSTSTASNYIGPGDFTPSNPALGAPPDFHSCPQFGENCNGTYH